MIRALSLFAGVLDMEASMSPVQNIAETASSPTLQNTFANTSVPLKSGGSRPGESRELPLKAEVSAKSQKQSAEAAGYRPCGSAEQRRREP
jgi:hypothetical protein